jgi:cytochrome b6-f complex iron-sulfur subunit
MNRRDFMTWAGAGLLSTSLPVALAACTSTVTSKPTASPAPSTLPVPGAATEAGDLRPIASLTDLKPGIPFEGKIDGKPFAISGDPSKPESIVAVNPTCTHKGCITPWNAQSKQFVCPCHGASFDDSGKVLSGPADKSLASYSIQVKDGKIFTKA